MIPELNEELGARDKSLGIICMLMVFEVSHLGEGEQIEKMTEGSVLRPRKIKKLS